MSNALLQIWQVFGTLWNTLFVSWKIPLLNFTPATLIFGVLSFFVAVKFIHGILTISVGGADLSADRTYFEGRYLSHHQRNGNNHKSGYGRY